VGDKIYLGFMMLHSFEFKNAEKIVAERKQDGLFLDLDDFIERVSISLEQLSILIKINAFRFTKRNKRELLWEAHMKVRKIPLEESVKTLFQSEKVNYKMPVLKNSKLEDAFDEIQYLEFPLCSPFDLLVEPIPKQKRVEELLQFSGRIVTVFGYYVTVKRTTTSKGDLMYFGTFTDIYGDAVDTIHFPPIAKKYPFRGKGIYRLTGKVVVEFDCVSIEISAMEKLAIIQDARYVEEKKGIKV
jgi:DNA polymerase-3 subunit alpha